MPRAHTTVTKLLDELRAGNRGALDDLFPLVYDELRLLAHRQRRRWRGDLTLNTTALVHEAYLKLTDQKRLGVRDRLHFMAIAARAMRHILCNYARDRGRIKRGGKLHRHPLERIEELPAEITLSEEQAAILVRLDDALTALENVDKRLSEIVECRFFGAMSIDQTAAALGLSPATVKRRWVLARSWIYREMRDGEAPNA